MKKKIFACAFASVLGLFALSSPSTAIALVATTDAATDITESGAILHGTVSHSAGDYTTAFAISTSATFSQDVFDYSLPCSTVGKVLILRAGYGGLITSGTSPTEFDFRSWTPCGAGSGLVPDTTYFYKVGIQQPDNGTCTWTMSCYTWGNTTSFVTRSARLAEVSSVSISEIGPDSARVTAVVSATDSYADVTVEYGTSASLVDSKTVEAGRVYPSGMSQGIGAPATFSGSKSLSGLLEDTTYYFRVLAKSIYGLSASKIQSFTTRPPVGISINDADDYTASPAVTLSVSWPNGAETMLVSNDGGFRQQKSFALSDSIPWTLVSSGDERLPKTVYLKFVMSDGTRSSTYSDDIILDTTAPVVTQATAVAVTSTSGVSIAAVKKNAVKLTVTSSDSNSGIDHLEVKSASGAKSVSVSVLKVGKVKTSVVLKTSKKSFLVRAIDRAGNPSTKWVKVAAKG